MRTNEDNSGRHTFPFLLPFTLHLLLMTTSKELRAQVSPAGKTYFAKISEVCKIMAGGGCVISDWPI
ncbi:MAG: hypothetical protein JWO58_2311 [Chitinophagaceae bacterium]|nr:hypothetical protein [Chitinophagaceae bacterium]